MNNNIEAETLLETPIEQQKIEIVERKGIGHPDSIADGIAEEISRNLSKMYLEKHDRILHHNTDEVQIVGGQATPEFGGGEILEPIYPPGRTCRNRSERKEIALQKYCFERCRRVSQRYMHTFRSR